MQKMIFLFLVVISSIFEIFGKNLTSVISTSPEDKFSQEQIGRIKIPNTKINDYIVQTTNNEFYLNHNEKKEWDENGAIFLDYRNELTDIKLLLYGHNSKYGNAPFKELEKYLEKSYFTQNSYLELILQEKSYIYQIFSIMIVKEGDYRHTKISFQKDEYQKHLNWLKEHSIYDTNVIPTIKDKIITIQTCYYQPENSYLLVNAKGV